MQSAFQLCKHVFTEHLLFVWYFRQAGLPESWFWAGVLGIFLESVPGSCPWEAKREKARWGRGAVRWQCSHNASAWLHGELWGLVEPSMMRQGGWVFYAPIDWLVTDSYCPWQWAQDADLSLCRKFLETIWSLGLAAVNKGTIWGRTYLSLQGRPGDTVRCLLL